MSTFIFIWQFTVREIICCFGLQEKSKNMEAVCGLGRTNYGGLQNVRPPIIDPHNIEGCEQFSLYSS